MTTPELILERDDSLESTIVQEALHRAGVNFSATYPTETIYELPALKSERMAVYGYEDIRKNALPDLDPQSYLYI